MCHVVHLLFILHGLIALLIWSCSRSSSCGSCVFLSEVLNEQAEAYVRAIQWILLYYFQGVPSWSWWASNSQSIKNSHLTLSTSLLQVLSIPLCAILVWCQKLQASWAEVWPWPPIPPLPTADGRAALCQQESPAWTIPGQLFTP